MHSLPKISGVVFASGTLTDGNDVIVPLAGAPIPCTVTINPLGGETVNLYYTTDGTNYVLRAAVTAYAEDVIDGPAIGLRFSASVGNDSTWSIC